MILPGFPKKRLFARDFIIPSAGLPGTMAETKKRYSKAIRLTMIASISVIIAFFQLTAKKALFSNEIPEEAKVDLVVEELPPPTQQLDKTPPPARPVIPIPTEDPEVPEDLTISETDLDFDEVPPPPPPPPSGEEGYTFIAYDSAPEPIGGFASLLKHLQYPELAKKAGVESKVIVGVLVDEKGNSIKTTILKESGANVGFEEAAQEAVMKMKWIPATQRDRPIKVWVSVIVNFQLKDS